MTHLLLILSSFAGSDQLTATGHGRAVAERLVAAIKGEAEFQDSDFAKRLGESDKAALRRFGKCRVDSINFTAVAPPGLPNVLVQDPNDVAVLFDCKGVPSSTPAGLSLHLKNGKISGLETHNADLMRVK